MRPLRPIFLYSIGVACTVLLAGCATTQSSTQNRESMLVAAGFKVITPKNQQLRAENKLSKEDLETAEMYQDSEMQWSLWGGGEGVWGPMAGPGPY